ncbi:MAG: aspartyl protease family protein [Spirochaetales bacterium]|nr:aspartyl protease family protein [Spirochaetales bacterium]
MKTKHTVLLLKIGIILICISVFGCRESKLDRSQILDRLEEVKTILAKKPDSAALKEEYATLLFQAGYFQEAKDILTPLVQEKDCTYKVLILMAKIEYLFGKYQSSQHYAEVILERFPSNIEAQAEAYLVLFGICFQTNQYEKSQNLFVGMEEHIKLPIWDLMKSFNGKKPNQINWAGLKETRVPFLITDPLPLVAVEIQGRTIYALIDTGGWYFILDNEIAGSMGIEAIASDDGIYAGGKKAETGHAKLDSLTIGGITISNLPIALLPIKKISKGFADGKYTIGGIIGTTFLQQFLPTIDYLSGTLILRPRSIQGEQVLQYYLENKNITEIPFFLAETHKIMVKGKLNHRDDLIFFVDSGLGSEACFAAPIQTLKYTGIPVPETGINENSFGGGGTFATGYFKIEELRLGPLTQYKLTGEYGPLTPEFYWSPYMDFIIDGLISHQFLKKYSWTIDFDKMKMIFAR